MKIKSKHQFECCDREQVWEKLMNIEFLSTIIPDSEDLKKIGKNKYEVKMPLKMKVKVKPFGSMEKKIKVKTTIELKRLNKPKSFRLIATGKGLESNGEFRLKRKNRATIVHCGVDAPSLIGKKVKKALPTLFD